MIKKLRLCLFLLIISSCIPEKEIPITKIFEANDSLSYRGLKSVEMYEYQSEDRASFTTAPPAYRGVDAREHWKRKEKSQLFWSDAHEVYYKVLIDATSGNKTIIYRVVDKFTSPAVLSYAQLVELLDKENCDGCRIVDISKSETKIYPEYSKDAIEEQFKKKRGLRTGIINRKGQLFSFYIYTPEEEDSLGTKMISDYSEYSTKYYYTGQAPDPPPPVFDDEGNIVPDGE